MSFAGCFIIKKFFVIDRNFARGEIFDIWEKVFAAVRYAQDRGYLPIFQIVSSDDSVYSDQPGDDIWNKFFLPPGDYSMKEGQEQHGGRSQYSCRLSQAVRIGRTVSGEIFVDIYNWRKPEKSPLGGGFL